MRTIDRIDIRAPLQRVFVVASDVERWPEFLSHYRWVRILERTPSGAIVDMAAWRRFGPVPYPTWWVSEMEILPEIHQIHYRHLRGITRGMKVEWHLTQGDERVEVRIDHQWNGPRWPLIGKAAANLVIGPVFIHHVASHTLAGVRREAERA